MAPHGFLPITKKTDVLAKPKTTIAYQTGVDVLGFPIYVEHKIYQDQLPEHKHNEKKHWVSIIQKIIKQH